MSVNEQAEIGPNDGMHTARSNDNSREMDGKHMAFTEGVDDHKSKFALPPIGLKRPVTTFMIDDEDDMRIEEETRGGAGSMSPMGRAIPEEGFYQATAEKNIDHSV